MKNLNELIDVIKRLRDKENGNAWDIEQNHEKLAPYIIEETYEMMDAVAKNDTNSIKDELGDILMLVIEMAQIAEDNGSFTIDDVAKSAIDKLHKRLPHFFGEDKKQLSTVKINKQWQELKKNENESEFPLADAFDAIPQSMPALLRAERIINTNKDETFWWKDIKEIFYIMRDEVDELEAEVIVDDMEKAETELGDVFIMAINIASKLGLSPDKSVRIGMKKFETRMKLVEKLFADEGKTLKGSSRDERDEKWIQAKAILKDS